MLVTVLLSILVVRASLHPANVIVTAGILRLFAVFAFISVVFNALTVHAGEFEMVTIPDWVPVAGGAITLNAIIYGILGALAILTLVLAGWTVAEQIDWAGAMRLLPDALLGVGAASSIAFTFFPQMLAAFREIREARLLRGAPLRTPLDYASMVAPVLSAGLDRAVTVSEMLEVRSFGGAATRNAGGSHRTGLVSASIVLFIVAAYFLATGEVLAALVLACGATVMLLGLTRSRSERQPARTRYRPVVWTRFDSFIAAAGFISIVATGATSTAWPDGVHYEPYPTVDWPVASLPLLIGLCALTLPAILATRKRERYG